MGVTMQEEVAQGAGELGSGGPDVRVPHLRYEDVIGELTKPFPSHIIEVRPGATTRDKKRAIALAYYDWRYMVNRLNSIVGGRNWDAHLEPWGNRRLVCILTILGVPKESTGEGEEADENGGTSAEQQAKKRAMAEHGLNYLYLLPQVWGEYDADKKAFVNPQALIEEMYRKARIDGLNLIPYITRSAPSRSSNSDGTASSSGATVTTETRTSGTGYPPVVSTSPTPPTPDSTLILEGQINAIRRLSERLKKQPPENLVRLTQEQAKKLLNELQNEVRAVTRSATTGATTTRDL